MKVLEIAKRPSASTPERFSNTSRKEPAVSVPSVYQLPLFASDKRCPACDTIKPLDAFPICTRSPSGVASYCKACKNAKWHAAHPQEASVRLQERWSMRRLREEGFKRCSRCHDVKPLDSFRPRSERSGQYSPRCTACMAEIQREKYSITARGKRNQAKRDLIAAGFRCCTICKEVQPLTDFYREARNSFGYGARCKICVNAANVAYVKAHEEDVRRYQQWYAHVNRDTLTEGQRLRQPRYRLQRRAIQSRRRARAMQADGSYTAKDIMALHEQQQGHCAYCNDLLTAYDVDHKQPLSRGGSNWPPNLCLACPPCNTRKHDKTESEFRALLASGVYDNVPKAFKRRGPLRRV